MAEPAVKVVEQTAPAETISGGHLVAKALKQEGVEVIFTLCGGHRLNAFTGAPAQCAQSVQ